MKLGLKGVLRVFMARYFSNVVKFAVKHFTCSFQAVREFLPKEIVKTFNKMPSLQAILAIEEKKHCA